MFQWIAPFCLIAASCLLAALAVTDLKTRLLPNKMVLGFAALGVVFHVATRAAFVAPPDILAGAVAGFGLLYALRAAANRLHGTDALGLGDVKLMGAGGIWLGAEGIMLAMTVGALAGMLHGIVQALLDARRTGGMPDFIRLSIPAGPGFAIGLVVAALYRFRIVPLPL